MNIDEYLDKTFRNFGIICEKHTTLYSRLPSSHGHTDLDIFKVRIRRGSSFSLTTLKTPRGDN